MFMLLYRCCYNVTSWSKYIYRTMLVKNWKALFNWEICLNDLNSASQCKSQPEQWSTDNHTIWHCRHVFRLALLYNRPCLRRKHLPSTNLQDTRFINAFSCDWFVMPKGCTNSFIGEQQGRTNSLSCTCLYVDHVPWNKSRMHLLYFQSIYLYPY